jgi:hypothetical protein
MPIYAAFHSWIAFELILSMYLLISTPCRICLLESIQKRDLRIVKGSTLIFRERTVFFLKSFHYHTLLKSLGSCFSLEFLDFYPFCVV